MLNSYRARLIIVFMLVLLTVQIVTAVSILTATHRERQFQQQQSLGVGINVFREVLANRLLQLNNSLSVLSADFGFKRAIATGESETILSVLENHGNRIDADAAVLLSPEGELISSSFPEIGDRGLQALNLLAANFESGESGTILSFGDVSYQFVLQPVKAPTLIAWVGMGFALDTEVATLAKTLTGVDVSFINMTDPDHPGLSTTLAAAQQSALARHLPELAAMADSATEGVPDHFLSYAMRLDEDSNDQWAMVHLSSSKWEQSYRQLRNNMVAIFAGILVLALVIAMWLSHGLTRPVRSLVHFAREVGRGGKPDPITGAPAELQVLADTLTVMETSIEEREQDLIYQSTHDSLTGLLNRFAAKQKLSELGSECAGTLLLLDLKQFRHINDIIGYVNADSLLVSFARRLEELVPAADVVARLDGDAFLLIYERGINIAQVEAALDILEAPFKIVDFNIAVNVSAGMLDLAAHGGSVGALLRRAEIALLQSDFNKERVVVYQAGEDEKYQRELKIISDLPRGLDKGQFHLVFQPKVDIQKDICVGAEALIRWEHPQLGNISPEEFVTLAENSGNTDCITRWLISEAIKSLVSWRNQGIYPKLAVNLSAHDLGKPELAGEIADLLATSGLPSDSLSIEVTEGAVMTDIQTSMHVLQTFMDLGISVAVDDFGTGHSSLAYLKMLPISEVKIDRTFVKEMLINPDDAIIVETSIALTHGLGYRVIVEGVEEEKTVDLLRQFDCDQVQGYLYSKPLTAADFARWYRTFNNDFSNQETAVNTDRARS